MRIISGKLKGSTLYLTKTKNTRPLKDLARESIFNLLTHSNKISFSIEKSIILDFCHVICQIIGQFFIIKIKNNR